MGKSITVERIHNALERFEKKANVSAYVILNKDRKHVGTVRFSYPRDGAGKLQALVADWSEKRPQPAIADWTPWQYGWASGGGYDKHSAAVSGDGHALAPEGSHPQLGLRAPARSGRGLAR